MWGEPGSGQHQDEETKLRQGWPPEGRILHTYINTVHRDWGGEGVCPPGRPVGSAACPGGLLVMEVVAGVLHSSSRG